MNRARVQPSRRRVSKHPLIEIGRAEKKDDALAGLERWKARHPEAAAHLQPADVLVDAMRGRFHTWTRIRVNLQHVPTELRPAQEALDPNEETGGWSAEETTPRGLLPRAEDLLELVRSRDLELVVAAIGRALVRAPPLEHRRMPESIALHVVVLHFADTLDAQRLPGQILAGAPAALASRHPRPVAELGPLAPRMFVEGVRREAARARWPARGGVPS